MPIIVKLQFLLTQIKLNMLNAKIEVKVVSVLLKSTIANASIETLINFISVKLRIIVITCKTVIGFGQLCTKTRYLIKVQILPLDLQVKT